MIDVIKLIRLILFPPTVFQCADIPRPWREHRHSADRHGATSRRGPRPGPRGTPGVVGAPRRRLRLLLWLRRAGKSTGGDGRRCLRSVLRAPPPGAELKGRRRHCRHGRLLSVPGSGLWRRR